MQTVILAGGIGTRLRPLTYQTPKSMIPICGKPFLYHQLEMLKAYELTEILLLVSYLGAQIEEYFGDGSRMGLDISYSYEKAPLGTGGALKNAVSRLAEEFLILNGDTYLPIDYKELILRFHQTNTIGLVAVCSNAPKKASNNIVLDPFNFVIGYTKKDSQGMTHIDAGAIALKRDVLNFFPRSQKFSLEEDVYPVLIKAKQLRAFPTDQRFYDMGSPIGLKTLEELLR